MPIDTNEKKLSLLSFGQPGFTLPEATGSFNQGDLQHLLGLYSDINVAEISPLGLIGLGLVGANPLWSSGGLLL